MRKRTRWMCVGVVLLVVLGLIAVNQRNSSTERMRQTRGHPGYWRICEDRSGQWWFLSPDGKPEFLNLVTSVQPKDEALEGPAFGSKDWNGRFDQASLDPWAARTVQRVRDAGFKGVGAWSNSALHRQNVPMTQDLNLWRWSSERIFSAAWRKAIGEAVEVQVVPLKNDRNLIGYYLDNELDWDESSLGARRYFDHLAVDDPNRTEVIKVIREIWPTVDRFNAAWHATLSTYDQLDRLAALPVADVAYAQLKPIWFEHAAREYFRFTCAAVRGHDQHHLILGVRFRGWAPIEVVKASAQFTDAQSINCYNADAVLDRRMFEMMHSVSGQPIIISEYSFHALDGRSGNCNRCGFAAQVENQSARAEGYRKFTTRMASVGYVIGCEWFQWNDEPPFGRKDGEDVNFGIVDIFDQPYEEMLKAVRETAPELNRVHGSSAQAPTTSPVWRK